MALQVRDQAITDDRVELAVLLVGLVELGREWAEEPTRAPPIILPRISTGSLIEAMVFTTPSTAATMPNAGSASATLCNAAARAWTSA
jgi:hypothetical protein